jgi:hypothetical protein
MSSGIMLEMGKGFNASVGLLGQDIGDLLLQACKRIVRYPTPAYGAARPTG